AVTLLTILFIGGVAPSCVDAADSNDDGAVDVADAIHLLGYLFSGTAAPPAPGATTCGVDPSADALGCDQGC
ncbi:MAG: hypothetical protein KDC38_20800, partial [Planctomycetes bacterium]|nr:hypothetical protein [Planctomycetota bacterium]